MESFEKKIDAKLVLSILAAGIMSFSGVVVETAMNVTFPTLMEEFGIGTSTVQWITTGYLLVLACTKRPRPNAAAKESSMQRYASPLITTSASRS